MICYTVAMRAILDVAMTQDRDVVITPTDDGWSLVSASADHVTLVSIDIPQTVLDMGEEAFAIEADPFSKALSHSAEAEVSVEDGRMTVRCGDMSTRLALIPVPQSSPRVPSFPPMDATAMVGADRLMRLVRATPKGGDAYRFTLSGETLEVSAMDSEGLGSALTIPVDEMDMHTLLTSTAVSSMYPQSSWQAFLKALPKDTTLELSWSADYPMSVGFAWQGVSGMWLVAPRIEVD